MDDAARQRVQDQITDLRLQASVLADLLNELNEARAYIDRLEKVLALHRFAGCVGPSGDRCHHPHPDETPTTPMPRIPAQRQPPIGELIGKSATRRAAQKRAGRQ